MPVLRVALVAATFVFVAAAGVRGETCPDPEGALGVARIVEIDASNGPVFGSITSQLAEKRFLEPGEVVLTFDDGPIPGVTPQILDTLDRFCTKATFFSVGRMALTHPALVREVLDRGHTMGTHTWSHPRSLVRLGLDRARDQIDAGFAAVALAAGRPIAPFFRFPGLSDSSALMAHLQQHGIAAFAVDVVSNDSYIADPGRLVARTLAHTETSRGGILLFHDIKAVTARALPTLLAALKVRGYRVVHLRPKAPYVPDERYVAAVKDYVAHSRMSPAARTQLLAVTDLAGSEESAPQPALAADGKDGIPPVTNLAPPRRDRIAGALPPRPEGQPLGPFRGMPLQRRTDLIAGGPNAHPAGGEAAPSNAHRARRTGRTASAPAPSDWAASFARRLFEPGG